MFGTFKLPARSSQPQRQFWKLESTTSLSSSIGSTKGPLSASCRKQFLQECWDFPTQGLYNEQIFDSYFIGYEEFCSLERPDTLISCPHQYVCSSTRKLAQGTRNAIEQSLLATAPADLKDAQTISKLINFIGKAVLRIDLVQWSGDESLKDYIDRTMGKVSVQTDRYRLPPTLNAATFDKKAGIRVLWERDLTKHLEIVFGDRNLKVFHDIALLDLLDQGPLKEAFPSHFIQETRRTIGLMLPITESSCQKWLDRELKRPDLTLGLSHQQGIFRGVIDRNVQTFHFWRDRLIVAKDAFDSSQPEGLKQLLRDDRNKVQYWTFWIAFIVFWLTLGGFITGCLQTYKAYYPSPQPPWPGSETS